MKGFKDTTKVMHGHNHSANVSHHRHPGFSTGGIKPLDVGGIKTPKMNVLPNVRPIMPRPHVMPNPKVAGLKPTHLLAKGGRYHDGGGGPYHKSADEGGSAVEYRDRPYSKSQQEFPDNRILRPGYKKGGMHIKPSRRGLFTKKMGKKPGHLTDSDVSRGLHSKSPATCKQANFARMARRGFKPLASGGPVCDPPGAAKREVARHVATAPPRGHGQKNLAFMREPVIK